MEEGNYFCTKECAGPEDQSRDHGLGSGHAINRTNANETSSILKGFHNETSLHSYFSTLFLCSDSTKMTIIEITSEEEIRNLMIIQR